jgi:hypothetical protein
MRASASSARHRGAPTAWSCRTSVSLSRRRP